MKKFSFLLLSASILLSGCGQSEKTVDSGSTTTIRTAEAKRAVEFGEQLAQIRDNALTLEAQLDFKSASKVWTEFYQRIVKQFGEDTWQAKNAELAYATAIKKSKLVGNRSRELRLLTEKTSKVQTAFANNQLQIALRLNEELLTLQENLFGAESVEAIRQRLQLAANQVALGVDEDATSNLHRGINALKTQGFEFHPDLEAAHAKLASIYFEQNDLRPAVSNQKSATRIAGKVWGTGSLNYARQAHQLGVIYHRARNLNVATEILNTAKLIRQREAGSESPVFAHSCLSLGAVMIDSQKLADAQDYLIKARSIFTKQLGEKNQYAIQSSSHLATVYMLTQQPVLAEPLLTGIINSLDPATASTDDLLGYRYKLAIALARQGKYDRAQPLLNTVIEKQRQVFGDSDSRTINSLKALARLLQATNQESQLAEVRNLLNRVASSSTSNDFNPRF